jgi:hypothetical protein
MYPTFSNEEIHAAIDRDHERMQNYTSMLADAESDAQMLRSRFKQLQVRVLKEAIASKLCPLLL